MTLEEMTAQRDALLAARYRGVRTVEIERNGRSEVLIGGGLPANERVIVSPIEIVTEGMRVRVEGDPEPLEADSNEPAVDDAVEDQPSDEQAAGF